MTRLASPPPAAEDGAAACAASGETSGVASAPSTIMSAGQIRLRRVVAKGIITRSPEVRSVEWSEQEEREGEAPLTLVRQRWMGSTPSCATRNRQEYQATRGRV